MSRKDKIKLGLFVREDGHHVAAWRHPDANGRVMDFGHYRRIAQIAERGKFDFLFLADHPSVPTRGGIAHRSGDVVKFEPLTLLTALAGQTRSIGLVGSASTTFNEPYHLARLFSSLDHLSGGRAGWNVVTSVSTAEANNFSFDELMPHHLRYKRAAEAFDVVTALWDGWEDDAFVIDKASGQYYDPAKVHPTNHKGEHFSVTGPLNVARPLSGYPVIVQAGSSDDGKAFAAKVAEVVFTAQSTFDLAATFYAELKAKAREAGRNEDSIKIMPGAFVLVASTRQEAQDRFDELQGLMEERIGLSMLSMLLGGVDLSKEDPDGPLPEIPESNGRKARSIHLASYAKENNLTIRQLYLSLAASRSHLSIVGTAEDVADQFEHWFIGRAADGFNILPATFPKGLSDFVDLVVPELQRRGLFRKEYEGNDLRTNLGLARPANQFAKEKEQTGSVTKNEVKESA